MRYARALFEVALENQEVDGVAESLRAISDILKENPQFAEVFFHPRLGLTEKRRIVAEVFQPFIDNQHVLSFVDLLLRKKREKEIPAIYQQFAQLRDEHMGLLPVEITVARPLADAVLEKMLSKLEKITGKKPIPTVRVQPEIIGGVVIRYGDKVWDGSIRTRLQLLERQIKSIPVAEMRGE